MLGGERDVYPNFTQALELSAEIGGEFACTLLSLARGAVWEYQRQLWDEADRVQRGLLGAERALAARQVDAVFRARALAERRDFERALQASVLRLKAAQKGTSKLGAEAAAEEAKLAAGAAGDEDDGAPPEPKPKDQYSGAIATVEARLEKTRAHILAIEGAIAAAEAEPEGGAGAAAGAAAGEGGGAASETSFALYGSVGVLLLDTRWPRVAPGGRQRGTAQLVAEEDFALLEDVCFRDSPLRVLLVCSELPLAPVVPSGHGGGGGGGGRPATSPSKPGTPGKPGTPKTPGGGKGGGGGGGAKREHKPYEAEFAGWGANAAEHERLLDLLFNWQAKESYHKVRALRQRALESPLPPALGDEAACSEAARALPTAFSQRSCCFRAARASAPRARSSRRRTRAPR